MRKIASALIGILSYAGVASADDMQYASDSYTALKSGETIEANFSQDANVKIEATGKLERVIRWNNGGCSKKIKLKVQPSWTSPLATAYSLSTIGCDGISEIVTQEKTMNFENEESFKAWISEKQPKWNDRGETHVLYSNSIATIYNRQPLHKLTLEIYKVEINKPQNENIIDAFARK